MIEQILPRIYRVHVPLAGNPMKELNSYVIKDDGRNLLIDTGFRHEACRSALQAALDELKVRKEETDVLLTHRHYDHAGLADLFVGKERSIYAGAIEVPVLDGSELDPVLTSLEARFRLEGFPESAIAESNATNPGITQGPPKGITGFSPLQDGDVLEIAGYKLKAILTPGHTPGHMCFRLEEQGAMFLGDHVLFDITPNITYWPEHPDSLGAYLDSLKAVRSFEVELPLPGHRASGSFRERIDHLLLHHEQRLSETYRVVKEHPGLPAYAIAPKMHWNIRASTWETFPVTQKWFAVGECMSHLDHLTLTGQIAMEEERGLRRYYAL